MPPFQGFIRFRRHLVGKQSSFGSNTAGTRWLPYRGAIVVDPARTDPDVDVGSLDPVLAPFAGPLGVTGTWEGFGAFDDLPYLYSAGLKGGVTPTGATAKSWVYQVASLTADDFDYFTDQWGDDVSSDFITGGSGVINTLELAFGDDLSAWTVNAELVYARAQIGTGPTGGIVLDDTPQWMYGADTEVYVDSVYSSIGTTKWTDTVHAATFRLNNNLDLKRFANGSNTRFQLAGYGRGPREIEVEIVAAKSAAAIAERATLDDTPAPVLQQHQGVRLPRVRHGRGVRRELDHHLHLSRPVRLRPRLRGPTGRGQHPRQPLRRYSLACPGSRQPNPSSWTSALARARADPTKPTSSTSPLRCPCPAAWRRRALSVRARVTRSSSRNSSPISGSATASSTGTWSTTRASPSP
jgi:hypothetical protein